MKTLLVVDDDPMIRPFVESAVAPLGYRVIGAPSLTAARGRLSSTPIDLVLCALELRGEDVLGFCRELRASPRPTPLPVIVLTGVINLAAKVRCFHAGAVDFVAKPLIAQDLRARILDQLGATRRSGPITVRSARLSPEPELRGRLAAALAEARAEGFVVTLAIVNLTGIGRLNTLYGREKVDELIRRWHLRLATFRAANVEVFERTPGEAAAILTTREPRREEELLGQLHQTITTVRDLPFGALARTVALRAVSGAAEPDAMLRMANDAIHRHRRPALAVTQAA